MTDVMLESPHVKTTASNLALSKFVFACVHGDIQTASENIEDLVQNDTLELHAGLFAACKSPFFRQSENPCVLFLLENGADPNFQGLPSLIIVDLFNRGVHLSTLLKFKANPNCYDNIGFHSLHVCVRTQQPQFLRPLLNAGADPYVRDFFGYTVPSFAAVAHDDWVFKETILAYVNAGCDMNTRCRTGETVLHFMQSEPSRLKHWRWLLEQQVVDVNIRVTNNGDLPIDRIVCLTKHVQQIQFDTLLNYATLLFEAGSMFPTKQYLPPQLSPDPEFMKDLKIIFNKIRLKQFHAFLMGMHLSFGESSPIQMLNEDVLSLIAKQMLK